jgi:hypothetical protein
MHEPRHVHRRNRVFKCDCSQISFDGDNCEIGMLVALSFLLLNASDLPPPSPKPPLVLSRGSSTIEIFIPPSTLLPFETVLVQVSALHWLIVFHIGRLFLSIWGCFLQQTHPHPVSLRMRPPPLRTRAQCSSTKSQSVLSLVKRTSPSHHVRCNIFHL